MLTTTSIKPFLKKTTINIEFVIKKIQDLKLETISYNLIEWEIEISCLSNLSAADSRANNLIVLFLCYRNKLILSILSCETLTGTSYILCIKN